MAGKLHHEYYWLALAPVDGRRRGRGAWRCGRSGGDRGSASPGSACAVLVALGLFQRARPGGRPRSGGTLPGLADVGPASRPLRTACLIAPEAVLYLGRPAGLSPRMASGAGRVRAAGRMAAGARLRGTTRSPRGVLSDHGRGPVLRRPRARREATRPGVSLARRDPPPLQRPASSTTGPA